MVARQEEGGQGRGVQQALQQGVGKAGVPGRQGTAGGSREGGHVRVAGTRGKEGEGVWYGAQHGQAGLLSGRRRWVHLCSNAAVALCSMSSQLSCSCRDRWLPCHVCLCGGKVTASGPHPQLASPVGGLLHVSLVLKNDRNLSYGYNTLSGTGATSSASGTFFVAAACAALAALAVACSSLQRTLCPWRHAASWHSRELRKKLKFKCFKHASHPVHAVEGHAPDAPSP